MTNATLHILVFTPTESDAEGLALAALFQKFGQAAQIQALHSLADFTEPMQKKEWDVLVTFDQVQGTDYSELLQKCQQANKDIATLLLVNECTPDVLSTGLQQGAAAVVPANEAQVLASGVQAAVQQVQERRRLRHLETQLRLVRVRDVQTGLYNKASLVARLDETIERASKHKRPGALLVIRLHNFHKTLDEVGVRYAETMTAEIVTQLKGKIGKTDILARLGENYFACLRMDCEADAALQQAEAMCQNLKGLLIETGDRTAQLQVGVGVSLIQDDSAKPEAIIQQAYDASRYGEAEPEGKAVHLYAAQLKGHQEASKDADLSRILEEAIRTNGFNLLFQPLMSMQGSPVEHYETFLRLKMPDGSEKSAGIFFGNPNISDDLKRKIDRWVILRTTKHLIAHQAKGHKTRIIINLAATSLADETLPKWIDTAVRVAKVPKDSLIFQFHESDAVIMLKQAQQFSHALKASGIICGISRFGSASNPMQVLSHLAVDYVKVDASFIQDLGNKEAQEHLQTMLEALHEQEKVTIIPSVENAIAMASLWQTGAHFLQGYGVQAPGASMNFSFGAEQEI